MASTGGQLVAEANQQLGSQVKMHLQDNLTMSFDKKCKLHEDNQLQELNEKLDNSKSFMEKVMYKVPLNKLYKVIASCQYNEQGQFCPVLVQLIHQDVIDHHKGMKYLLQIWTNLGEMIFEKPLAKALSSWNISDNKFVFQETMNSQDVYLVKLCDDSGADGKPCIPDKAPVVFKFTNKAFAQSGPAPSRTNNYEESKTFVDDSSKYLASQDDYLTNHDESRVGIFDTSNQTQKKAGKKDVQPTASGSKVSPMTKSPSSGAKGLDQSMIFNNASITEMARARVLPGQVRIIERSPAKMIDYLQDNIILAQSDKIVYFNVAATVNEQRGGSNFVAKEITDELQTIEIQNGEYTIELLQEIGNGMSAIVLQSKQTKELRFLRAEFDDDEKAPKAQGGIRSIKLVQLGVMITKQTDQHLISPLLKFRSVAKTEINPVTREHTRYQVGIAIRENGKIEVYSDFILVDEYYDPDHQCVDIETNFNSFYLKMVKNCSSVDQEVFEWTRQGEEGKSRKQMEKIALNELPGLNGKIEIRMVPHFWRNRISINTSTVKKGNSLTAEWEVILHKRISGFFRLYTQVLNYQVHMLVSHGRMISVYDMSLQQWVCTLSLDKYVHQMFIKKKSREERRNKLNQKIKRGGRERLGLDQQYEIVCVNGSKYIQTVQIKRNGELSQSGTNVDIQSQDIEGKRLIQISNDEAFNNGMLFLTDNQESGELYKYEKECNCQLYTFPFNEKEGAKYFLYVLKHGKFFKLLSSDDPDVLQSGNKKSCISYDSYFKVLRVSKSVLQVEEPATGDEKTPLGQDKIAFEEAFGKKQKANVVICTSDSNDRSMRFIMVKERNKQKYISGMRFLKNISQEITVVKKTDDEPPLHSFFITEEEYDENKDNYIQISEKMITVYNKTMQNVNLRVEGLKIRNCIDVNQSYMYTISDRIEKPFEVFENDADEGQIQPHYKNSSAGLYVFDIAKLFQGKIEKYKLVKAIGGVCNILDNSKFSDRFSFIQNYNTIAVIPFPHLNLINCIGMDLKREYMVWRERNGFFTALDRRGELKTWSLLSGKLLYKEIQKGNSDGRKDQIEPYQVYQSDPDDITYTRRFYESKDRTINLLKSIQPFLAVKQTQLTLNEEQKKASQVAVTNEQDSAQILPSESSLEGIQADLNEGAKKLDKVLDNLLSNSNKRKQDLKTEHDQSEGRVKVDNEVKKISKDLFKTVPKADLTVLSSQQQVEKYHFKVMQLQVYQDFLRLEQLGDLKARSNDNVNECKMRFHFFFDLIYKPDDKEDDKLKDFDWDISSNLQQRLYLSLDTTKMMEVINNFTARVYRRVNLNIEQDAEDCGQEVEWVQEYTLKRFPKSFFDKCSIPYLFSPNFTYMLDFDYDKKQFVIKETKSGNIKVRIPSDLVKLSWGKMQFQDAIKQIASRFKWINEREINFVNERNLDTIFEIVGSELILRSTVKIDNLFENSHQRDSPHLLLQPLVFANRDVLERLMRMNQDYKRYVQHSLARENKRSKILTKISRIDYLQEWSDTYSKFDIELSFTWLDWRIMELEINDDTFDIHDVEDEQKIQLAFNIFPMGRGVLHYLAIGRDTDKDDHVKNKDAAEEFFRTASVPQNWDINGVDHEVYEDGMTSLEIPILPDMYGATPLDISLAISKQRKTDKNVFYSAGDSLKTVMQSQNDMMADVIFMYITNYGFMHSSQLIHEAIIKATELALPNIGGYLESRLIKIDYISNTQNPIIDKFFDSRMFVAESLGDYGMITVDPWTRDSKIVNHMFQQRQEGVSQKTMEMQYCDIPSLFKPTEIGKDFISALALNPNIDLFNNKSIQVLINAQQKHWMRIDILAFFLPRLTQLIIFFFWSNIILPNLGTGDFDAGNKACSWIMNIISLYLLLMDIPRLISAPKLYFTSLSVIVNLVCNILILVNTVDQDLKNERFWSIQTWAALTIWFRLLLKIRMFKDFSWLIRMIIACITDMTVFMVVLFIGVFAFADAFHSVDKVLELNQLIDPYEVPDGAGNYEKYWKNYIVSWQKSFLTTLGEFDGNLEFYRESDWFVFFICCIFNIILLLNLLIAIISETFANVAENAVANSYKEKVKQIQEMQLSIFGRFSRQDDIDSNSLMFLANVKPTEDQEVDPAEKIDQLFEELSSVRELAQQSDAKLQMLIDRLCPDDGEAEGQKQ